MNKKEATKKTEVIHSAINTINCCIVKKKELPGKEN